MVMEAHTLVLLIITQCSLIGVYQQFREAYCFYLQRSTTVHMTLLHYFNSCTVYCHSSLSWAFYIVKGIIY